WQIVAESIALLNAGIKFSSNWVKCERSRIAHSRSKRSLARPVCLESLNGGLDLRFHTNVAGRSHAYKHGSGFRIQGEVTVLVSGNCADHTFLSDQFLPVCREHRLALLWRHIANLRLIRTTATNRASYVRDAPDPVLIGNEYKTVPESETVRSPKIIS